ncbi:DUF6089 family protein [Flavobacterium sp.]|uniref:type IX secretion system protein PorG n=1 Tax=Flavobacterium sp. TaxID=239 RepID=UPI002606922C|nr:DUF6089 family protein [Flavobacterium sp.]MDD2985120.1 DUF6089 family protein [Flavobacterium sp.]
MNRLFILLFFLLSSTLIKAQINEIGFFLGGSNYIGDVGPTTYIAPHDVALGFVYRWNRSTRHSYRFSYTYGKISSDDLDSDMPDRYERGLSFKNNIHEFSAGLEFNFFEFDLHKLGSQFTPYVYTGINYFSYKELYYIDKEVKEDYTAGALAIPMVLGVKAKLNRRFILSLEAGARFAFTDNLDGSNPKNENLTSLQFGNINSNDWYVFTGFMLTYTFGENPCYCPD